MLTQIYIKTYLKNKILIKCPNKTRRHPDSSCFFTTNDSFSLLSRFFFFFFFVLVCPLLIPPRIPFCLFSFYLLVLALVYPLFFLPRIPSFSMSWELHKLTYDPPRPRRTPRRNIRDPRLPSYRRPSPLPLVTTPRTIPLEYSPVAEAKPCRRPKKKPTKVYLSLIHI